MKLLDWKKGGLVLGTVFFLAIFLVKPIGASTQYSEVAGIIQNIFDKDFTYQTTDTETGYGSLNSYYNKSEGKLAKNVENPIHYSMIFVLSLILGGFIASKLDKSNRNQKSNTKVHDSNLKGNLLMFFSGLIAIFGARFAGGCTSGHMMSGIMQTSISGLMFAVATFATAVPTAIYIGRKK